MLRLVVIIVLVLTAAWWATEADVLHPAGNELGAPVSVGEARITLPVVEPILPATLVSVRPHEPTGGRARVSFFGCLPRDAGGLWVTAQSRKELCLRTRPVRGTLVTPTTGSRPRWVLAVEVQGLEPGRFKMKGVEVWYRRGPRVGREIAGTRHVLRFHPKTQAGLASGEPSTAPSATSSP